MSETKSLYDRLGGREAMGAAVDEFYRRMLADDRVSAFFSDVEMSKQKAKQRAFLSMAFGGPAKYTGKMMSDGHRHLLDRGLNDTHVDVVIEHLGETLRFLGAGEDDVKEAAAIAESVRDDVLCRKQPSTA